MYTMPPPNPCPRNAQARLLAAVAEGVFVGGLPWNMVVGGVVQKAAKKRSASAG